MRQLLHRIFLMVEKIIVRIRRRGEVEGAVIENYDGYANRDTVILRGRVLEESKAWEFRESDSGWRNFRGITRYWFTREIPNATIHGEVAGEKFTTSTNEEGYFRVELPLPTPITQKERFITFRSWLAGSDRCFEGLVQVIPESAERIIISDIDDTVMETGARQLWQMLKTTLFKNIHTRSVFPGVATFYQSLLAHDRNPLFYVTSSPWNLRAFLQQVFELRKVPRGPSFMTDWGLDRQKFLKEGHGKHKLRAIRHILTFHDDLPCLLIGDSGEKDPEIYRSIVEEFPGRVQAVYIRDVSDKARDQKVLDLGRACSKDGVPFLLVDSTAKAAQDARERKFITLQSSLEMNPLDEAETWTQPIMIEQASPS